MIHTRIAGPVAALLVVAATGVPVVTNAQAGLSNTEDARVLPRGVVRLRLLNDWTRFDEQFVGTGTATRPLGAALTVDSLGARQIPALAASEAALRTLTGDPTTRFQIGHLTTKVDARIVTTPFVLEYGVTNRLQFGLVVPVVQARSTVLGVLNPLGTESNLGPNPALVSSSAALADSQVVAQFFAADSLLRSSLASCQSTPTGPNCATLLARLSEAQQLLQSSASFAAAVALLYGGGQRSGQLFVPLDTSALQSQINRRVAAYAAQYSSFFIAQSFGVLRGAAAPGALLQLHQLLADPRFGAGMDSLQTRRRIGIGDIEVSAAYRLFDGLADTARTRSSGGALRASLQAVVRLGTGYPARPSVPFDNASGTGQSAVEGRAAVDMRLGGRLLTTVVGGYTLQIGSRPLTPLAGSGIVGLLTAPASATARKLGDVVRVDVTPRLLITDYLTLNGYYALSHQAPDTFTDPVPTESASDFTSAITAHRVGFGFGYSTVAGYGHGEADVPIEFSLTHLETIVATGGLYPKYYSDQLQVRIYFRLLGR